MMGRDSSVGIATGYGLDGPGIESRWGAGENCLTRPDRPWGPSSLIYSRYRVFPGDKAVGAWRWPIIRSSAEVKERVELYLYSPSGPLWPVPGWTVPVPLIFKGYALYNRHFKIYNTQYALSAWREDQSWRQHWIFWRFKKTYTLEYPSVKNEIPLQVDNRKRIPKKTSGKNVLSTNTKWVLLLWPLFELSIKGQWFHACLHCTSHFLTALLPSI
jgi:hypothetical protein